MVLEFPILSDYCSLFFEELGGKMIYLTHGHHGAPPLQEGDILVSGHTHIPVATKQEGIFLVNPGSVAIPKGGFPPSYCLYEERTFTIMDFVVSLVVPLLAVLFGWSVIWADNRTMSGKSIAIPPHGLDPLGPQNAHL